MRLSAYIAKKYDISRRFAKTAIAGGKIKHENSVITRDITVDENLCYIMDSYFPVKKLTVCPEKYLIRQEKDVLFLYKPPFMHTERHTPADDTCLDDIMYLYPGFNLISRLDYAVDGIVSGVKVNTQIIHMEKKYLAWVDGTVTKSFSRGFSIDADKRRKVKVHENLKAKPMFFKPLKTINDKTLMEIKIPSAARHQVRAVLAYLNLPIIGDYLYNNTTAQKKRAGRILLHCFYTEINHISAQSPHTDDFSTLY